MSKTIIEQEELTITGFTRKAGAGYTLWIKGDRIPRDIPGIENINGDIYYRIRLLNTGNLDKTSPGWFRMWNKENIPCDITSWKKDFKIIKDNGKYTLTIRLKDTAVVEKWHGEDW